MDGQLSTDNKQAKHGRDPTDLNPAIKTIDARFNSANSPMSWLLLCFLSNTHSFIVSVDFSEGRHPLTGVRGFLALSRCNSSLYLLVRPPVRQTSFPDCPFPDFLHALFSGTYKAVPLIFGVLITGRQYSSDLPPMGEGTIQYPAQDSSRCRNFKKCRGTGEGLYAI